jgi:hypothetical protein
MTFSNYLQSKQKILIFYFLFHGVALFVNVFGIKGEISSYDRLLTEHKISAESKAHFWPIVKFVYPDVNGYGTAAFVGIFQHYDYSEFIAYVILIFVVFYFMWNSKKTSLKN